MATLGSPTALALAQRQQKILKSLRFNDGDTAYLNRTPSSSGNQKTWTWSGWLKRSTLGAEQTFFGAYKGGNDYVAIQFDSDDTLNVTYKHISQSGGSLSTQTKRKITSQVFRDVSAWYHIVVKFDAANTNCDIYVNGEEVTAFGTDEEPSNLSFSVNENVVHYVGTFQNSVTGVAVTYFDGYMTEVHLVDGTALAASDFGRTDNSTGAWVPRPYEGSHGTNGFYLQFLDNSDTTATTLGKDTSGNGNNWTPNNFSVSAGTDNDSMEDTPTNNWCTLNPLNRGSDNPTVSNGNLYLSSASTDHTVVATFAIPSSGKWYWEYSKTADANLMSGIIHSPETGGLSTYLGGQNNGYSVYATNGQKYTGAIGNQTYMATPSTSTTITIAFDADTNKLYFGADGNWGDGSGNTDETFANAAVAYTVPTGKTYYPAISFNGGNAFANFGQRAFDHTPPAGYKALNTANLPVPTIKDGTDYFNTVLYTGDSSTQSITGVGFQPDWVWIKGRPNASKHVLTDAVRGATKTLISNDNSEETTSTGDLTSFDTDGFSVGSNSRVNGLGDGIVAWNWKAGGNSSTFNVNGTGYATASAAGLDGGTITPTGASVNTAAGISIIAYTGDGNNPGTSTVTVSHGLGASPAMIITKKRSSGGTDYNWSTWHQELPRDNGVWLNLTNAKNPAMWDGDDNNSSTLFSPADKDYNNVLNETYINYIFAEVESFSKMGYYDGNSSTDGTYVHTNFAPALLIIKRVDAADSWHMYDNKRETYNANDNPLYANLNNEESPSSNYAVDFLSNGFKLRTTNAGLNTGDYIFMAFAETPFKYVNAR